MKFPFFRGDKKRVYLDYASSTPIDPSVTRILTESFAVFYNPSSIHKEGVLARNKIELARSEAVRFIDAQPDEIIFTGSGTESCVLAIRGVVEQARSVVGKPHVITSMIEHASVLETIKDLERRAVIRATYLQPDHEGRISVDDIKESIQEDTVLISVMMVNNEVGTIEPIKDIGLLVRKHKNEKGYPLFHTDASQAVLYNEISVLKLHTDLLTLDGIKCRGPRGIGLLYVKRGIRLAPVLTGGGQEKGLRSGTENISAICGFAHALTQAKQEREVETNRVEEVRAYAKIKIKNVIPNVVFNESKTHHSPHILSVCFPACDAEFVVISLDALGIAAAWGSACKSIHGDTSSYVLAAMGKDDCMQSSVRFSFGKETTKKDIDALCDALVELVHRKVITTT